MARTSAPAVPFAIEEVVEFAASDPAALADAIRRMQPKRPPSGFLNAVCGVYPPRRVLRRATLEPKKLKEPGYLAEVLSTQLRVEPDKHMVQVLNANDGLDFDPAKLNQKEVLFCGMLTEEANSTQDGLLERSIYPDRLELGSVAMLGGMVDYLAFNKSKTPVLILEVNSEATHSFIVTAGGVEASRPIAQGLNAMVPVVQKELGLKDEESARKLFFSNTFDFTGMGPLLVKKLLKELQSSIGFYEVQTGQSVGQVLCTSLPAKLAWLETAIASALGVATLQLNLLPWLQSRQITVPENVFAGPIDAQWLGLFGLMASYNVVPDAAVPEKKE
ncbi:hypothetical protein [Opitutus terrae]|nr:hypothetical protein [Opitutus terrae]